MRFPILSVVLLALHFVLPALQAQSNYPPELPGSVAHVYKSIDGVDLKIWAYEPENHSASDRKPALVFFFGGGWRSGTPRQFHEHSKYLASRGMVAAVADYRVASRHGVKAFQCVKDAKAAVRWLRRNAARLGIDPDRIAAGGGSAGGHLAASTALLPGHDDAAAGAAVSSRPNALALFNPGVVLAPVPDKYDAIAARLPELTERMGADPVSLSPYHHVGPGAPPAVIFHGRADTTVPYRSVEIFTEKMQADGNRCELHGYEGKTHGFFNFGRDDGLAYYDTVRKMDAFFVSLGWLTGQPTIRAPSE